MQLKFLKIFVLSLTVFLITGFTAHKFYVSTTNIEFVPEKEAVQIISKIFIDDIEDVLTERYQKEVSLNSTKETPEDLKLLKAYILEKFQVEINNTVAQLTYLGIEYDIDTVKIFIEINDVTSVDSIEIENKVLMDLYEEQQNIIHIKTPDLRRSLILEKENPKGLLNLQ